MPLPARRFCSGHTFFIQQSGRREFCLNVHVTFTEGGVVREMRLTRCIAHSARRVPHVLHPAHLAAASRHLAPSATTIASLFRIRAARQALAAPGGGPMELAPKRLL